jgi:hypothetical protein
MSIIFGFFLYSQAIQIPQENDNESFQTVQEAEAIVKGCHRYGLIEYSHHPIGRAYLLTPFTGNLKELERIPLVIGVVAAAIALFACLMVPSPLLMKVPILASFTALLWQGGFMTWIGNLHQHSYNFSIFFLLVAIGVTARRSWPALAAIAFIAGWIGYDFLFIYAFTILTIRFLYWTCRENNRWGRAAWAAIGETSFFLAVFIFDMTLKFIQNTLYFSSAIMAQQDLFLNIIYRTSAESSASMSPSWRFDKATHLASVYVNRFMSDNRVTHKESLIAVGVLLALVVLAQVWRTVRSRSSESTPKRWGGILVALISSSMTILAWLYLAPNHAEPHVSLFARLLLIPCILYPICISLGFAHPRATPIRASNLKAFAGVLTCTLSTVMFILLPFVASEKIDQIFYNTAWDPQSAGLREEMLIGEMLSPLPTASSTSSDADVMGPLKPKGDLKLVYVTNFWGRNLDENRSLRWMPDPKNPLPAWYQLNFTKPVQLSNIALRFWDLTKHCGKHTPESFYLEALDQNGQTLQRVSVSSATSQAIHQGKYLNFLVPFSPNVTVSGVRLVIEKTVGGDVPVLFDFHAFGTNTGAS